MSVRLWRVLLLGLLAAALGERDRALNHYQDALAFCQRSGYRPEYAWTASDYAEALQDGGLRDIRESRSLHDEALSIGRELGMRPLTERVVARQQRLNA